MNHPPWEKKTLPKAKEKLQLAGFLSCLPCVHSLRNWALTSRSDFERNSQFLQACIKNSAVCKLLFVGILFCQCSAFCVMISSHCKKCAYNKLIVSFPNKRLQEQAEGGERRWISFCQARCSWKCFFFLVSSMKSRFWGDDSLIYLCELFCIAYLFLQFTLSRAASEE